VFVSLLGPFKGLGLRHNEPLYALPLKHDPVVFLLTEVLDKLLGLVSASLFCLCSLSPVLRVVLPRLYMILAQRSLELGDILLGLKLLAFLR